MTETKDKAKLLRKAWRRPKDDFLSCAFDLPDIVALQALQRGDATPDQQKRALDWLISKASGFYELSFCDNERDSNFSEGRRFVGKQVVNMLALNPSVFKRSET